MPGAFVIVDIDGRRLLLGEQAAENQAADAGGNADADLAVVGMGGRGLDGADQRAGGDGGGDQA